VLYCSQLEMLRFQICRVVFRIETQRNMIHHPQSNSLSPVLAHVHGNLHAVNGAVLFFIVLRKPFDTNSVDVVYFSLDWS
jgi:hypothetical protein